MWARAGRRRVVAVGAAVVVSLGLNSVLILPLVPVDRLGSTPIPDINYDAGETVAVLTANYGEAGTIDRFATRLGPALSGHNAYWS